ncbi:Efflux ABC transporter, ATP-binding protein [hydrothermal vent metagenome]|uniref:Efflux ABC transporter, ATP-binding protein n=1 Tax=hydrothermal vent metagenome TaxID=652676 RepID=A0A3B0UPM6_9ZZZZ
MIKVENLSFAYPKTSAPVLRDLSFSIGNGEIYGLLGPSGSGKSTTQKILMGLLQGFSGEAKIFGQSIRNIDRSFYEKIGVSFELPTLYLRLTALENLKLFAALYQGATKDPMEVLGLVDLTEAANQRVGNFSKGMKMRLNLCRAFLNDPELLFLDEPTTGQDPARARHTRQLILKLKEEGKTIFLTTHNMAEADEICDRVGFLTNGYIPVSGVPDDLKRQYGQPMLEVTTVSANSAKKHLFPMENIGKNAKFLKLLDSSKIRAMHTMEASLDDVFIKVTEAEAKKGD